MHKSFSLAEKTGVKLSESFSFGINVTKSELLNLLTADEDDNGFPPELRRWKTVIGPVSFNEGLLENVPNTFELRIFTDLTRVEVYYPASLERKKYGVHVSEMKLSLLADDQQKFHVDLFDAADYFYETDYMPSPLGHRNLFTLPTQWRDDAGLRQDKLTLTTWPSCVNELKIDIIISEFKKPEFTEYEDVGPAGNVPKGHMDPSKYFLSTELSDVSIRCQETTFPAHIFILAYNSPVFAKMFQHEMKETTERCVEIENVDPTIFGEMLRYFYTGGVENLENNAMEVYNLADRYLVDNLKSICIRSLVKCLKSENAAEIYYFGRMKEIPVLTVKATGVLISNKKKLVTDVAGLDKLLNVTPEAPANLKTDLFRLFWDH